MFIQKMSFPERKLRMRKSNPRLQKMSFPEKYWRMRKSNPRPPACKADALPTELIPRVDPGYVI